MLAFCQASISTGRCNCHIDHFGVARSRTFGLCSQNTVHPENISADWRHMDVICDGAFYCHLDLKVIGKHNALNALGAAAAAWKLGIPGEAVAEGLKTFGGADRRMQYKGSINGADVYDDYAHHPDELKATIEAVRTMKYDRVGLGTKQGTTIAVCCSAAITCVLLFLNKYLFGIFTETTELIDLAVSMMRIMAVGYICISVTQVLGGALWLQILIFSLVSCGLLACLWPVTRKLLNPKLTKTNVDAVIGATGLVTVSVDNVTAAEMTHFFFQK